MSKPSAELRWRWPSCPLRNARWSSITYWFSPTGKLVRNSRRLIPVSGSNNWQHIFSWLKQRKILQGSKMRNLNQSQNTRVNIFLHIFFFRICPYSSVPSTRGQRQRGGDKKRKLRTPISQSSRTLSRLYMVYLYGEQLGQERSSGWLPGPTERR